MSEKEKPFSFAVPVVLSIALALVGLLFFDPRMWYFSWYPVVGVIWIIVSLCIGIIWVLVLHYRNKQWFGQNYRTKPFLTKEGKTALEKRARMKESYSLKSWKADTVDECKKHLRDVGIVLVVLSVVQLALGFWLGSGWFVDAFICCVLGLLLWTMQSVVAAYLFLIYSILSVIAAVLNSLHIITGGGTNVILAALFVWYAWQSIVVAKKLRKLQTVRT